MLVTRKLFLGTWGGAFEPQDGEFWPDAIDAVKDSHPDFLLLAEVYCDEEYNLMQQGFHHAYDKVLYERLLSPHVPSVRIHLIADLDYQRRLARFIENHDEDRALAVFGAERSRAAAVVALTAPGLRLVHEGQMEGRRMKLPVQFGRRPRELADPTLEQFYRRLITELDNPVFHDGRWEQLEPQSAWPGNLSHNGFVAYQWSLGTVVKLVAVNLSFDKAQCYLWPRIAGLAGSRVKLRDRLGGAEYERDGDELLSDGLFLEMPGHAYHLFDLEISRKPPAGLRLRRRIRRREKGIYDLAWSPDGKWLASAGEDKSIHLWSLDGSERNSVLAGHSDTVGSIAWSPKGDTIASGSNDGTIRLWDIRGGNSAPLEGQHWRSVLCLAWSPKGGMLASASIDRTVNLWNTNDRRLLRTFGGHTDSVNSVAWSPDGAMLASGSGDRTLRVRDVPSYELTGVFDEQTWVSSIDWSRDGRMLASGTGGGTVSIWDVRTGRRITSLERHLERVLRVSFSCDSRFLATKSADNTVRIWRCATWEEVAVLTEEHGTYLSGLAFHPTKPVLATRDDRENEIRIWDLDMSSLGQVATAPSTYYTNAKVILVGDSGVGKSALANVLAGQPYEETQSTHGRRVLIFERNDSFDSGLRRVRETLLWDLAGQPDYRPIHQLQLTNATLVLVVFDSRNPTDPFAGVHYWRRAVRQAERLKMGSGSPIKMFLVAARADRGRVAADARRIETVRRDLGFDRYFQTSAMKNWEIEELAEAIRNAIESEALPTVPSDFF
jgi:WD40 repeat protein/GTPase SAR1 family protein